MYCICCNQNKVIPHEYNRKEIHNPISEEDILWKNEESQDGKNRTINNDMVSGGIIQIIEAGYGSKHDGDQIILAICDECIVSKLDDATLLYFGNYMGFSLISDKDIEKSKKTYRRRRNLDELT
jgi:hypothetical protein